MARRCAAGMGKTTTIQAANSALEREGLAGRIARVAYTGVAASNMGPGSRASMSLLRLHSRNVYFGQLSPLSEEDMTALDAELGRVALLEINELLMLVSACGDTPSIMPRTARAANVAATPALRSVAQRWS